MSQHTKEPWTDEYFGTGDLRIRAGDYDIADLGFGWDTERAHQGPEDAHRIVACVNGCAGLNPQAYLLVISALRNLMTEIDIFEAQTPNPEVTSKLAYHEARHALTAATPQKETP